MDKHISMISETSQLHLRNIGNIRKFLGQGSAGTSVHSDPLLSVRLIIVMFFCLEFLKIR